MTASSSGRRVLVSRQEHKTFTPISSECCYLGLVNAIHDPFLDVSQHIPEVHSDLVSRESERQIGALSLVSWPRDTGVIMADISSSCL